MVLAVMAHKFKKIYHQGFTITELLIGIAIVAIIAAVAMPSLSSFLVKMRVDNQISEIQRMILTARNSAVNMGQRTTLCPLAANNSCTNNWQNALSVFIDLNQDNILDANDTLIKVKPAVVAGDNLRYSINAPLSYQPTGVIVAGSNGNFIYCPSEVEFRRGISISPSGRATASSDLDNDDIDEFIGTPIIEIVCP
tara:strand:- start:101 stop:688 length:588 start_codon:yes stop_codon:yes gene_type:complete